MLTDYMTGALGQVCLHWLVQQADTTRENNRAESGLHPLAQHTSFKSFRLFGGGISLMPVAAQHMLRKLTTLIKPAGRPSQHYDPA